VHFSVDQRHKTPRPDVAPLVNLLANAAKYTQAGGRIQLIAGMEGAEFVCRVRDNGVGISPELLSRMFDLFAQADQSLARSEGGLGWVALS
jgi:signal transduction histidine kinase